MLASSTDWTSSSPSCAPSATTTLKRRAPSLMRGLACLLLAPCFTACGSDSTDPNASDPLRDALVVHCDMPQDHVCREYQRAKQGDTVAFVDLGEVRSACAQGWPGGPTAGGVFAEGSCSPELALARCRTISSSTVPPLTTLDYFYPDFGDTATADDPIAKLRAVCDAIQSNAAAAGIGVTSLTELPPF